MEFDFNGVAHREQLKVFSVSEIISVLNELLEEGFSQVLVRGEISELSISAAGHVYFTLKDDRGEAALRVVIFKHNYMRRRFDLSVGRRVVVGGFLTIYPQRGSFQLVGDRFIDAGEGLFAFEFERLKRKLMAEGLMDEARKRTLPPLPSVIGIVTSLEAAALQDMLRTLRGRFPARIIISPAPVQGQDAAPGLVTALKRLAGVKEVEVVIIGRGGGSVEDLSAFNDEELAREIAAFPKPVISAVGHEVDWTISDLVADFRAPTPTAAAQVVIPGLEELVDRIRSLEVRIARSMEGSIARSRNRIYMLTEKIPTPDRLILNKRQRLDEIHSEMVSTMERRASLTRVKFNNLCAKISGHDPAGKVERDRVILNSVSDKIRSFVMAGLMDKRRKFEVLESRLDALSPLSILARGYSITMRRKDGRVVRSVHDVSTGDRVHVRVADGVIDCEVKGD